MNKEVICHTHGFFSHRSDKNSSSHNSDSSNSNNSNSSNSSSSNSNGNKRETDRGGSFWLIHSLQGGDGRSPQRSGKSKFSQIMPLPFYVYCVVFAAAVKNCSLPLQVPLIWRWRSPAAHLNIYKYRTYRTYFYDFTIFPASFCNSFLSAALIRPPRLVIRRRSALNSYRMRIA